MRHCSFVYFTQHVLLLSKVCCCHRAKHNHTDLRYHGLSSRAGMNNHVHIRGSDKNCSWNCLKRYYQEAAITAILHKIKWENLAKIVLLNKTKTCFLRCLLFCFVTSNMTLTSKFVGQEKPCCNFWLAFELDWSSIKRMGKMTSEHSWSLIQTYSNSISDRQTDRQTDTVRKSFLPACTDHFLAATGRAESSDHLVSLCLLLSGFSLSSTARFHWEMPQRGRL